MVTCFSQKQMLAFHERTQCVQGCPTDSESSETLPTAPWGQVAWPGHVPFAGGHWYPTQGVLGDLRAQWVLRTSRYKVKPLLGPVAARPLEGQRMLVRIRPLWRLGLCSSASPEAVGLQGPGQKLKLPGLDRQATGESQEQERRY